MNAELPARFGVDEEGAEVPKHILHADCGQRLDLLLVSVEVVLHPHYLTPVPVHLLRQRHVGTNLQ